jgi:hypothetical protein
MLRRITSVLGSMASATAALLIAFGSAYAAGGETSRGSGGQHAGYPGYAAHPGWSGGYRPYDGWRG